MDPLRHNQDLGLGHVERGKKQSRVPENLHHHIRQSPNIALQTSWGSREGADADDAFRMIALPPYGEQPGPANTHDALYDLWHDTGDDVVDDADLEWIEVQLPQYNETIDIV